MMNITEACEILQGIASDNGNDVLETVIYISNNLEQFEPHEVAAYKEFMRVGRDFFAEV